jgi:hypothetical protein
MDSPVGTGFSYATSDEGLKSSDTQAVRQLAIFLRKVRRQRALMCSCSCCAVLCCPLSEDLYSVHVSQLCMLIAN